MTIRPSQPSDIPAIVDLLRLSLGDSLMPKTERYWQWKHQDNPFGTSPVVVAYEGNLLVGVRAFMCWQWKLKGRLINAVRAVDTATHPQHQGKGIFKKLTLQLVDQCRNEGRYFIFNTPNNKSRPGYLKMGWQDAGKFPIRVRTRLGVILKRKLTRNQSPLPDRNGSVSQCLEHAALNDFLGRIDNIDSGVIKTSHTKSTLKWRYHDVPVVAYHALAITHANDLKALGFYRFKHSSLGMELRVTDAFCETPAFGKQLTESLLMEADKASASHITISGIGQKGVLDNWFSPSMKVGPIVTFRELNAEYGRSLMAFSNWGPSIGDLELF